MMKLAKFMRALGGWKRLSLLAAILLPACSSSIPAAISPAVDHTPTSSEEETAARTTSPEASGWQAYRSEQAGYSVEFPADWIASEQAGADGSSVTNFTSANGSAGIMVLVQNGESGAAGSLDLPNTRCDEVRVGGLSGTRCFATLSSSTATVIIRQGKTYTIASTSKRLDPMIYDHFLASFQFSP